MVEFYLKWGLKIKKNWKEKAIEKQIIEALVFKRKK